MKSKSSRTLLILWFTLISCNTTYAQDVNPQALLDSIQIKINKVKDYSADIKITLDVDFIKIPVREAKIFFKQPDKVRMKSNGFALLPKRGLNFSSGDLLNKKYQAIYIKRELLNKVPTLVVKIVPLEDNSEILLATVWIDRSKQLIRRIDASTKSNGSFTINFEYPTSPNPYDLPQTLSFDFDVNQMEIPAAISGDYNTEKPKEKRTGPSRGKIRLVYSNYLVNKGIPDSFFKEKNPNKK